MPMMSNNDFNKKLNALLDNHKPQSNYDELWSKLEPQINKKKRRPILLWYSAIAGISVTALFLFYGKDISTQLNKSTRLKVVPDEIGKTINIVDKQKQNDSIYNSVHAATLSSLQHSKPIVLKSKNVAQKIQVTKIKDVHISLVVNNETIIDKNETSNNSYNLNPPFETNTIDKYTISEEQKKNTWAIDLLPITEIKPLIASTTHANVILPITENQKSKTKKLKFDIGIYSLLSRKADKNTSDSYANSLDKAIRPIISYSINLGINRQINSLLALSIALKLDRITEKYKMKNEILESVLEKNENAFTVNGQKIGAIQSGQKIYSQDIVHYNQFDAIYISPGVVYKIKWPFEMEVKGMMDFPVLQMYKGLLSDEKGYAIKDGKVFENRKLNWFNPTISFGLPIDLSYSRSTIINLGYSFQKNAQVPQSPFNHNRWHRLYFGITYSW